ncbi:threonine--tRNA ligase [Candidatus Babeliales bacterium]|nr:threonine--tRNA ligase [Candidatus Babeliales bacterium]
MAPDKDILLLRHSAAHLLAHAVTELYPGTLLTIGPATETGFFYDFLPLHNFKESDLPKIEQRMLEIAQRNLPIEHKQVPKAEALKLFKDNPFKLEMINQIPEETVGIATQGDFYDLCKGGHVLTTGDIKHFKLTGISGSYWRADRSNQALQRLSGIVFFTKDDLIAFEDASEQAKLCDHRRLGKQLELFSFHDEGVGFPFFHPKGKTILNIMIEYLRTELTALNYQELQTPVLLSNELWKRSGHWDFYKDKMYFCTVHEEDTTYAVRPMNCPGSILIYKDRPRSYRELPLKLSEFGLVHRYELSGVLHGLMRARAFTIDDAHIYCTVDQMEQEILETIELTFRVLKKFGFHDITVGLSTRPEESMGDAALWEKATNALKNALNLAKVDYNLQEGEGAFYGPKIEFVFRDSMGREWQGGTIQVDFCNPENFDMTYIAPGGTRQRPVMIHRAIYGSLERFFAVVLEHYKGILPLWLSPVQACILTITDEQKAYAQIVYKKLRDAGLRVEVDESSEKISAKIKTAQLAKIPWMLILGKKEADAKTITLRKHDGSQAFGLTIEQVILEAKEQ